MSYIIKVSNLVKYSYSLEKMILDHLNLNIEENEFLTITGKSNVGKSLLLKIMGGIINDYESGTVSIFNKNILELNVKELKELRENIGFIFQHYTLFDSLTIGENIGFALTHIKKLGKKEILEKVNSLLESLNLSKVIDKYPYELSGGMNKRVSIARSIIYNPKVIFLDEPTAGLDPINSDSLSFFIKRLTQKFNMTFITISSDVHYIRKVSKKVALLNNGKIEEIIKTEDMLHNPESLVYQFLNGEDPSIEKKTN